MTATPLQKPDNAPEARGDLEPTNQGVSREHHRWWVRHASFRHRWVGEGGKELASQTRCVALTLVFESVRTG